MRAAWIFVIGLALGGCKAALQPNDSQKEYFGTGELLFERTPFEQIVHKTVIAAIISDYYIEHGAWPQNAAVILAEAKRKNVGADEGRLERVSRLQLRHEGGDLQVRFRLKVSGKFTDVQFLLSPGKSVDEIMKPLFEEKTAANKPVPYR